MLRKLPLALALTLCLAHAAPAQDTARAAAPSEAAAAVSAPAQTQPSTAAAADTGRVPVPPPSEKAVRYHRTGNWLWAIGLLWALLVPAALLFTGTSARIRTLARRAGRKWFFTLAIYVVLITLLVWVIDLPLAYYQEYVRPHRYGLSNQTLGKWIGDSLKALAIAIVVLPLVLWVPYLLIRRSPRRWWLYAGLAAVPFLVLTIWATPVFFDPLFNDYGRMQDRRLEADILALADRAGIEGGRVYEVNKSVDTNALNAYVTGFAGSKRIVLWDTLLEKMGRGEVLFVMGHEMGHYVLRHVLALLAVATLLVFVSLYAVHRTAGWLIARFEHRFGFTELGDVASYPLLVLVVGVVSLAATPLLLAFTRHMEHEADRFGLELTQDNRAAATAFVKLQEENLGVPYPGTLYKIFRASHPVLGERIEFANEYRPWETGRPLKYADRFE